jgi:hypothetical protein
MKNASKFFVITVLGLAFSAATFAQASATANASATIVGPIAIARTAHMNFGNVAVNATPGTVQLDPDATRTPGGGVTLPATTGTVSPAIFTVSGADGYSYAITLPGAALTITDGTNNMTVSGFTSTPSGTGSLAGGSQELRVGATLNVGASQVAGTYTSAAPFTVTVNYN